MKTIAGYIRDYLREEWDARFFALVGLFLLVSFVVNFGLIPEVAITSKLREPGQQFLFYLAFYGVPFLFTIVARAASKRDFTMLRSRRFWGVSGFTIVVLACYVVLHRVPYYVYYNYPSLYEGFDPQVRVFVARCVSNFVAPAIMAIPLLVYWYRFDRHEMRVYGFDKRTIDLKPYFVLLLLLVPLLVAVSFTDDFQRAYPRLKFGWPIHTLPLDKAYLASTFEICYGADFVFVEFFFRGFMVLGLARVMGTSAIMAMVPVYAFLHFEKPLIEALSSIFGGLALGVISYRTNSIYGGIVLHLGIAYVMELAGAIHYTGW